MKLSDYPHALHHLQRGPHLSPVTHPNINTLTNSPKQLKIMQTKINNSQNHFDFIDDQKSVES